MKLEDYFRRENLHFHIIPENARETNEGYVQKVKQALSNLGAPSDFKSRAICRMGKPKNSYGVSSTSEREPSLRPILACLLSPMDFESIWFKRKALLKSPCFSTVLIEKDLPPKLAREWAKL